MSFFETALWAAHTPEIIKHALWLVWGDFRSHFGSSDSRRDPLSREGKGESKGKSGMRAWAETPMSRSRSRSRSLATPMSRSRSRESESNGKGESKGKGNLYYSKGTCSARDCARMARGDGYFAGEGKGHIAGSEEDGYGKGGTKL